MSRSLLIEIGVEELPASFLRHALASMAKSFDQLAGGARLGDSITVTTLGTPRRMSLHVDGLNDAQTDKDELVVGPPSSAAFSKDGEPQKAGIGFAKKHGLQAKDLQRHQTDKGEYVAVRVQEKGRKAEAVLADILPTLCAQVSFPKSMRWGEGNIAFGRPVHWVVALFGETVLPFSFAGIDSGRTSRGHRFLSPDTFEIKSADTYVEQLKKTHVWVDSDERKERIQQSLHAEAKALGGELQPDEFLINECVSLVEAPFVVPGSFEERYLELPDAVVVSVMRDHQRYFAVRDSNDVLLPVYLNVVNTANEKALIAKGNDRVLRARLKDAEFFVREDKKSPLISRLEKLKTVTFQSKLGTVGAKIDRIERLSKHLAKNKEGVTVEQASEASRLCKCDLETLIVYEFPELQGEMGRWYAEQEGIDSQTAKAIEDHYRPKGANDDVPEDVLSAVVGTADRMDTLVGCFGIGLLPTGSADPFALRRAALGILRTGLDGPIDIDLLPLIDVAYDGFEGGSLADKEKLKSDLYAFFVARLKAHMKNVHRGDVIDACLLAWDGASVRDVTKRMKAVSGFRDQPAFESLATAFKRAHNITKETPRGAVVDSLLEEGPEADLAAAFKSADAKIDSACKNGEYADALLVVASTLQEPIDRFFEEVFVMVDDEAVRQNRLHLLGQIADGVNRIAHLHQLLT